MAEDVFWSTLSFVDCDTERLLTDTDTCVLGMEWASGQSFDDSITALQEMTVGAKCSCGDDVFMKVLNVEPTDDLKGNSAWVCVDVTPIRQHRCRDAQDGR
jgi:hypothetical protein